MFQSRPSRAHHFPCPFLPPGAHTMRTTSAEAGPSATCRAPAGRFAVGNAGGPGNPFARQTAALRAYLIEHVTERDLQDILDILLLNAKGGHLPSIKLLFAYVLGKPKPVVEPDLLDRKSVV